MEGAYGLGEILPKMPGGSSVVVHIDNLLNKKSKNVVGFWLVGSDGFSFVELRSTTSRADATILGLPEHGEIGRFTLIQMGYHGVVPGGFALTKCLLHIRPYRE